MAGALNIVTGLHFPRRTPELHSLHEEPGGAITYVARCAQVAAVLQGMARERGVPVGGGPAADALRQGQGAAQQAAEGLAQGLRGVAVLQPGCLLQHGVDACSAPDSRLLGRPGPAIMRAFDALRQPVLPGMSSIICFTFLWLQARWCRASGR